ncbi:hypothetical protein [Agrobacterium tumefaciens]|uniref:hypothetical protein n=1 Tax=Agrobacterium tumefaciens TaxID=358 RepID=UPI001ADC8D59|nr:hypothetical protein [Agrobacterium tumefaciens]
MSVRKKCMQSKTQALSRIVPLDVQSAEAMDWDLVAGILDNAQPMIAPDVPDNRNGTPYQFRLAYFYPNKTIARYTNDVDGQASIEFNGPALACGVVAE